MVVQGSIDESGLVFDSDAVSVAMDCTNTCWLASKAHAINYVLTHNTALTAHSDIVYQTVNDINTFISVSGVPHLTSIFDSYGSIIWYDGTVKNYNGDVNYLVRSSVFGHSYEELDNAIDEFAKKTNDELRTKQYKLVAGDFIVLSGDVISHPMTEYVLPIADSNTIGGVTFERSISTETSSTSSVIASFAICSALDTKQQASVSAGDGIAIDGTNVSLVYGFIPRSGSSMSFDVVSGGELYERCLEKNGTMSFSSDFDTVSNERGYVVSADVHTESTIAEGCSSAIESSAISAALSLKQNALVCGETITISDGRINSSYDAPSATADSGIAGSVYLTSTIAEGDNGRVANTTTVLDYLAKKNVAVVFSDEFDVDALNNVSLSFSESGVASSGAVFYAISKKMDGHYSFSSSDFDGDAVHSLKYGDTIESDITVSGATIFKELTAKQNNLTFTDTDFSVDGSNGVALCSVDAYSVGQSSPVSGGSMYERLLEKEDSFSFDDEHFSVDESSTPITVNFKFGSIDSGDGKIADSHDVKTHIDEKLDNITFSTTDFITSTVTEGYASVDSVKTYELNSSVSGAIACSSIFAATSGLTGYTELNENDFRQNGAVQELYKNNYSSAERPLCGTYYASSVFSALEGKKDDFTFGNGFSVGSDVGISFGEIDEKSAVHAVKCSDFTEELAKKQNNLSFDNRHIVIESETSTVSLSTVGLSEVTETDAIVSNTSVKDALDEKQNPLYFGSGFIGTSKGEVLSVDAAETVSEGVTGTIMSSIADEELAKKQQNLSFSNGVSSDSNGNVVIEYSLSTGTSSNNDIREALESTQNAFSSYENITAYDGTTVTLKKADTTDDVSPATKTASGMVRFDSTSPLSSLSDNAHVTIPSRTIYSALYSKIETLTTSDSLSLQNAQLDIIYGGNTESTSSYAISYGSFKDVSFSFVPSSNISISNSIISKTDTTYQNDCLESNGIVRIEESESDTISSESYTIPQYTITNAISSPEWVSSFDSTVLTTCKFKFDSSKQSGYENGQIGIVYDNEIVEGSNKLVRGGTVYSAINEKSDTLNFSYIYFTKSLYTSSDIVEPKIASSDGIAKYSAIATSGGAVYDFVNKEIHNVGFNSCEITESASTCDILVLPNKQNIVALDNIVTEESEIDVNFKLKDSGNNTVDVYSIFVNPSASGSSSHKSIYVNFKYENGSAYENVNALEGSSTPYHLKDKMFATSSIAYTFELTKIPRDTGTVFVANRNEIAKLTV